MYNKQRLEFVSFLFWLKKKKKIQSFFDRNIYIHICSIKSFFFLFFKEFFYQALELLMHTRIKKKGIHSCVMSKWWVLRQSEEVRKIGNIEADGGLETDHFFFFPFGGGTRDSTLVSRERVLTLFIFII